MSALNFDTLLELCMTLWVDKSDYVSLIWIWRALVKNTGYRDLGFYLFFYLFSHTRASPERLFSPSFWKELSRGVRLFEIMNIGHVEWYGDIFSDRYAYLSDRYWPYKACCYDKFGKLIELDLLILKNLGDNLGMKLF